MNRLFIIYIFFSTISFAQTGPGGIGQTNGSSELEWWLKADEGVYEDAGTDLAESGDGVYQWNDASGYGRNIQQTTLGNRPVYTSEALNGHPVIRFTSSNGHYLGTLSIDAFQNNYSFFVVGYATGNSQDFVAVTFPTDHGILLESQSSNRLRFLHRNPTGVSGGNSLEAGSSRSTSTPQILSFTRGTPSSGTQQYWINGSDNQSITGSNNNFTSSGSLVIGRLGSSYPTRYLEGDIAEVILFSKEVNSAERISVENYLAAKYGITLSGNDVYDEDEAGAGNFDYEIAGIGRVDASNIHNDAGGNSVLRILNPTGLDDDEFLFWGHDNAAQEATETSDVPSGVEARFERLWRASEVNSSNAAVDVGAIDMRFDLSGLTPVTASDLRLIVDIDNDATFSDETAISGASSLGGDIYEFAGVTAISNNVRFTLGTSNASQTALPVEWIDFWAEVKRNLYVQLNWQTASEANNALFTIERSPDGEEWYSLFEIEGAGYSTNPLFYSSIDERPLKGHSFYRIKQTDFDGKYSYSSIRSIFVEAESSVKIFPNPAKNLVRVDMDFQGTSSYEIYTCTGHRVSHGTIDLHRRMIDLSYLPANIYYIRIGTTSSKIVKAN